MITNNKIIIIYTVILSLLSLFTNMLVNEEGQTLQDGNYMVKEGVYYDIVALTNYDNSVSDSKFSNVTDLLFFILKLPFLIFKLIISVISLPFEAIEHLPVIFSIILYTPYTIILVFDVIIPLVLKFAEVIGEYIPFT